MCAPPNASANTPNRAKPTAARPAAKPTEASSGASSSASAPADRSSIETPMMAANVPHRLARIPRSETWRSMTKQSGQSGLRLQVLSGADEHVQLDACGRMVPRRHREAEPGAVGHARRHGHVHLVAQHFGTGAGTPDAQFGPRLAAPTAFAAYAAHRHVERP